VVVLKGAVDESDVDLCCCVVDVTQKDPKRIVTLGTEDTIRADGRVDDLQRGTTITGVDKKSGCLSVVVVK